MWINWHRLEDFTDRMTALLDDALSGFHADAVRRAEAAEARLADSAKDLATTRAQLEELRARVAANQTTIDFLTRDVNTLNLERAALLTKLTGINMPMVEMAREGATTKQVVAIEQLVEKLPAFKAEAEERDSKLAEGRHMAAIFEDVGDDEAKRQGLKIGPLNELVAE